MREDWKVEVFEKLNPRNPSVLYQRYACKIVIDKSLQHTLILLAVYRPTDTED